ncbi:MAG: hypothetical protein PHT44_01130 [Candidatus Portnoybacteria bacterium]|nr:hypothetical protein [Candidatus Portnoybacteria bacterium]MDD4982793.1 hypothetical protein [Candidatus Portnoybacteria bacterium]
MEFLTAEIVEGLKKKGWEKTEREGKVILRHPDLMGSYSVFDAIRTQKMLDSPAPSPRASTRRTSPV